MVHPAGPAPGRPAGPRRARQPPLLALLSLALAALLLSLPVDGTAQSSTTTVGGRVLDAVTGRPLEGVRVWVVDAEPVAWTGRDGRFQLTDVPVGLRFLRVAFLGTVARGVRIRLREDREHELDLRVRAAVLPLPPLHVTVGAPVSGKLAGFHRRRERGFGHFITRDEIERRAPLETSDLFRILPGVRVGPRSALGRTRVAVSRSLRPCPVAYFLDGKRVPGFHVDDVPPEEIDGIEIYRGASQIPAEFRRHLTCAAVVIWTRDPARDVTPPS